MTTWTTKATLAAAVAVVAAAGNAWAADPNADLQAEVSALKARIAELEKKESQDWLTTERTSQIRAIVEDVIKDARGRGQFLDDNVQVGYKDGFFVQTGEKPAPNYKLVVGGFVQARYEYGRYNATDGRTISGKSEPGDANGFDIRRARVSFSGNLITPNLTYKLEGDFYGNATGNFTVTDAFIGYRISDPFQVRVGSFKVPFAKAELTSDTALGLMERPDVLFPFDPVRALGASVWGYLIKDQMTYEVNINDGANTNTLRRVSTEGTSANLDNRLSYYGRWQWTPNGKVTDFADEPDLRKDNRDFIWMIGAAGGMESQNANSSEFPSPQNTVTVPGLSGNPTPGFLSPLTPTGNVYRATVDWSAKYQGWSFLTAAYFQQVNSDTKMANPLVDTSGFAHAYYGQVGYFIVPQKFEVVGRAGVLLTEGGPNIGEFYSLGANYYLFGNHSAKLQADVTYSPEAAFTDSGSMSLINTHEIMARVQLQIKF